MLIEFAVAYEIMVSEEGSSYRVSPASGDRLVSLQEMGPFLRGLLIGIQHPDIPVLDNYAQASDRIFVSTGAGPLILDTETFGPFAKGIVTGIQHATVRAVVPK